MPYNWHMQRKRGVILVKKKTSLDLMREIRTTWTINPRTRVHDNDIRKSKKKMRSESRKVIKKALGDDPKSFFHFVRQCKNATGDGSHVAFFCDMRTVPCRTRAFLIL